MAIPGDYVAGQVRELLAPPFHTTPWEVFEEIVPDRRFDDPQYKRFYSQKSLQGVVHAILWRCTSLCDCVRGIIYDHVKVKLLLSIEAQWQECLRSGQAAQIACMQAIKSCAGGGMMFSMSEGIKKNILTFRFSILQALYEYEGTLDQKVHRLYRLFHPVPPGVPPQGVDPAMVVQDLKDLRRGEKAHAVIHVTSQMAPPIRLLRKVALGEVIQPQETSLLEKFYENVAACHKEGKLQVRELFLFLHAIVKVCGGVHKERMDHLARLLYVIDCNLEQRNCPLLSEVDPIHKKWVEEACGKKEPTLRLQHQNVTFMEELKGTEEGEHRVFTAREFPESVFVLNCRNAALPFIEYGRALESNNCLPHPRIDWMSASGVMCVKKMKLEPISNEGWERRGARVNSLARFFGHMCDEEHSYTPVNLSKEMLYFSEDNQLYFLRAPKCAIFRYNAVAECLESLLGHNVPLYMFVVNASQLSSHPVAKFYQKMLELALNEQWKKLEECLNSSDLGVQKADILKTKNDLQKEMEKLFCDCFEWLKERYEIDQDIYKGYLRDTIISVMKNIGALPKKMMMDPEVISRELAAYYKPLMKNGLYEKIGVQLLIDVPKDKDIEPYAKQKEIYNHAQLLTLKFRHEGTLGLIRE